MIQNQKQDNNKQVNHNRHYKNSYNNSKQDKCDSFQMNSVNNIKNDSNSACFNQKYCFEWNIPLNDNLVNIQGYPLSSLIDKFELPEYDECMSMHQCAITKKIPLNGTLYIYNSKICFFSRYNADTLVGKATIVSIPLSDVSSVQKKKTGFIFNQGIEIILKNHQHFFFSAFKDRDQAYNYMTELLSWQKRLQPSAEDLNIECIRQELQALKQQIEQSQISKKTSKKKIFSQNNAGNGLQKDVQYEEKQQDIIQLSSDEEEDEEEWEEIKSVEEMQKKKEVENQWNQHIDKLTQVYQQRVEKLRNAVLNNFEVSTKAKWTSIDIKNVSAKEIYILFFGNNIFEDEKQVAYTNFGMYYNTTVLNELNMVYSDIVPEPPLYFTNLYDNNKLEIIDYAEYSTRKCTFTHIIKEPFMPKSCDCFIEEKIYWVSPKEILIERELAFQGIPLSSHFNPRVIYQILETGESDQIKTQIRSGYYIHYVKDTWFKSKIDKTSDEENIKNWEKISKLYIKYSEIWIKRREQGLQLQKKQKAAIHSSQIKQQTNCNPEPQNNVDQDLEIIQSSQNTDDKQIADIADVSQSMCNIF
ncbi:GRAM domain protein (macronuclear) [Tetrahymena thermophila SB210]|uniref:GRAM domain protein n=1 Tax=Tetrahymena thermophila (strain SB210) TaxID=312017 RepID=Q23QL2_TETTS|nr:GRAM domain protein [Tetrahymena thermophila SB210]EAR98876.1 GRAM domain protein [Tetrahymena thermophila SB210]|eukprot:XP_001019121.1 GRAM domain protein [Tetrahymena thermophila SB210]